MPFQTELGVARPRNQRIDDDVRFIRSWFEKPLSTGALIPSSKLLARTMASFVDPFVKGPVVELGPGTGPITEALLSNGIDERRLVLVEFNAGFCRLLRKRYPKATVVHGDAYHVRRLFGSVIHGHAAAVVSGLPYRGLRPVVAGRAFRAVYLCRSAADPALARERSRRGLRAHLAKSPAGARLDLPQGLTGRYKAVGRNSAAPGGHRRPSLHPHERGFQARTLSSLGRRNDVQRERERRDR
jgi:phospholipid N-methyltransferase